MVQAEAGAARTQTVPSESPEPMRRAAYNSRIIFCAPGMLTPSLLRFFSGILFVLTVLFAVPAETQNWGGAEEQLAGKIVAAAGPKTMALEVMNRSSLSAAMTDD